MNGRPVTEIEKARMLRLRADGHTIAEIARRVGRSPNTVRVLVGAGRVGKVAVAPLREAFLASGRSAADLARHMGWYGSPGKADSSRVRRALGLLDDVSGSTGSRTRRQRVDYETAERIGEFVGVAAWELEDAA